MKLRHRLLLSLFVIFFITYPNLNAQNKKIKIISAGIMVSRITEKPFEFSNGHTLGIKPMIEYQVEKNLFGGYYFSYGIGLKGLGEQRSKTFRNFEYHDFVYTNTDEGYEIDTVITYIGDLTNKHKIKISYIYFPVGFNYYAGEKLSFGMEYSLAYALTGKYGLEVNFTDVDKNYTNDYSINTDLVGNNSTKERYVHNWDHWLRLSAKYNYKSFLFRFGVEKGLRNIFTGKDISNDNKPILFSRNFKWQNVSAFLSIGVVLPN